MKISENVGEEMEVCPAAADLPFRCETARQALESETFQRLFALFNRIRMQKGKKALTIKKIIFNPDVTQNSFKLFDEVDGFMESTIKKFEKKDQLPHRLFEEIRETLLQCMGKEEEEEWNTLLDQPLGSLKASNKK